MSQSDSELECAAPEEAELYLLSLLHVEIAHRAVVCKQVTSTQQLCQKVDVSIVLQKAIIIQL